MESKYIDLLLIEKADGSMALVVADAHKAEVGSLVEFDDGKVGRVVMKAWIGERGGEVHNLVSALVPVNEAEAVYFRSWQKEDNDGEIRRDS